VVEVPSVAQVAGAARVPSVEAQARVRSLAVPGSAPAAAAAAAPTVRRAALAPISAEGALPREGRVEALAKIAAEIAGCKGCHLCNGRTLTVPGVGDPMAELMFIGEGPGADEDRTGIPFVGAAGKLLTKIIEAMTFTRDEVFIANIVKCRPPGNRAPLPEEMATCIPYLERQIEVVRPKVIVTLGMTALRGLFPHAELQGITKVRGTWMKYRGIEVMPTLHPAYLLRSPSVKKDVWADMQVVMAKFGKKPA
jgi:uracil-DNA glycosylase family 4